MTQQAPSQFDLQELINRYQNGLYVEAEALALFITKQFPEHPFSWKILGGIYKALGRMTDALAAGKKAVELDPGDNQAHNSLGVILEDLGRFEDAEASYRKAILLEPDDCGTHYNLGNVMRKLKKFEEAATAFRQATTVKPDYAEAHSNLGVTLQELGRLEEAEASCRQAIAIASDFAEAHYNLGNAIKELGRLEEAEAIYTQAISLKSDYTEAYNNLGITLQELGRLEEAEESCRQAIAIAFNFAEAHYNLGNTLKELGRKEEAIESYKKAIALKPDFAEAYVNIALALSGTVFRKPNPDIQELITSILDQKTYVRPRDISTAAISLLKFDPALKTVFLMHAESDLRLLLQKVISDLSEVPLLLKLMSVCPIADLELEALLTDIRSVLLATTSEITGSSEFLRFQSALALQCFTNEYVYVQTDNETKALGTLEAVVKESLLKREQPSPQAILCLAAYKALHDYEWSDLLTMTPDIEDVFARQAVEPKQELRLKSDIPILQEITDKVSSKVRQQYEKNPYPRWVSLGLPFKPASVF